MRSHSVDYGIQLVRSLLKEFPGTEYIEFFDDTFTLDKEWLDAFLKEFSKLELKFVCNSRFDLINEKLVKALSDSGCVKINAAVECGSEEIRRNILRRPISNELILEKSQVIKKHGIALFTHNMVGVPYETHRDIRRTVELNKMIKPDAMQVSVFRPYPKSDLGRLCSEENWIDDRLKTSSFHDFTVLRTPYIKPHIVDYYLIAFESMVCGRGISLLFKKMLYWFLHFHHNRAYLFLRRARRKANRIKVACLKLPAGSI